LSCNNLYCASLNLIERLIRSLIHIYSILEDDLLEEVDRWVFTHTLAEFVKRSADLVGGTFAEFSGFVADRLVAHARVIPVKLSQILRFAVSHGPLVVLRAPNFSLLLTSFFSRGGFFGFSGLFSFNNGLNNLNFFHYGLLEFLHLGDCGLITFLLVGKGSHSGNFTNAHADREHLIHVADLETVFLVLHFLVVAKTFEQNVLLSGALGADSEVDEVHHTLPFEVNS